MNINSMQYWDNRFRSGDWELKDGRIQTMQFALTHVNIFNISKEFDGVILDFGCGLGDAIPVYKYKYPAAKLIGMDISGEAIKLCRKRFGDIAIFIQGDHLKVPEVDIIISSNVFEHLSGDLDIAKYLLGKCRELFITVPYKENIIYGSEHVNSYDENYYIGVGNYEWNIFSSRGWSQFGFNLYYNVYFKNVFRIILGKQIIHRGKQIMYHFTKVSALKK